VRRLSVNGLMEGHCLLVPGPANSDSTTRTEVSEMAGRVADGDLVRASVLLANDGLDVPHQSRHEPTLS
jgi:hypothetical protein